MSPGPPFHSDLWVIELLDSQVLFYFLYTLEFRIALFRNLTLSIDSSSFKQLATLNVKIVPHQRASRYVGILIRFLNLSEYFFDTLKVFSNRDQQQRPNSCISVAW